MIGINAVMNVTLIIQQTHTPVIEGLYHNDKYKITHFVTHQETNFIGRV